jgi:hypothetical protein
MMQGFRAAGIEPPRRRVESFSVPLHERLVTSESFITALPSSMARFGRHLPLKVLPIELPAPPRPIARRVRQCRTRLTRRAPENAPGIDANSVSVHERELRREKV